MEQSLEHFLLNNLFFLQKNIPPTSNTWSAPKSTNLDTMHWTASQVISESAVGPSVKEGINGVMFPITILVYHIFVDKGLSKVPLKGRKRRHHMSHSRAAVMQQTQRNDITMSMILPPRLKKKKRQATVGLPVG